MTMGVLVGFGNVPVGVEVNVAVGVREAFLVGVTVGVAVYGLSVRRTS
jgi:hypothetical protein